MSVIGLIHRTSNIRRISARYHLCFYSHDPDTQRLYYIFQYIICIYIYTAIALQDNMFHVFYIAQKKDN